MLHGSAWGLRGPFMQAIRADYFGRGAIGMISAACPPSSSPSGRSPGRWWPECSPSLTGNYRSGFTLLAFVAGSGSLLFMLAKKPG